MSKIVPANIIKNCDFSLTPLRQDVLDIFFNNKGPLKAYDIINQINSNGRDTKAISVYRVLNFLVEKKILHKIHSKNIFTLCTNTLDKAHKNDNIFLICKKCNAVQEISDENFLTALNKLYSKYNFSPSKTDVELEGYCKSCATN